MAQKTYQRNNARRLLDAMAGMLARFGMSSRTGVLTTTGRHSGQPRSTPVDLIRFDGHVHVVGIYGAKAWVLNLRANPACTVRGRGGERAHVAVELPVAEGAPVLGIELVLPVSQPEAVPVVHLVLVDPCP